MTSSRSLHRVPAAMMAVALLGYLILAAVQPIRAATFSVTTTADGGAGSLRQAISDANANPGADTITVPAGIYEITLAGAGENANATGDFDITDDVTIVGAGVGVTYIDADFLDRAFDVMSASATFRDMSIRNGEGSAERGGAIRGIDADLSIEGVALEGNATEDDGGAIYVSGGSLLVLDSLLRGNEAGEDGGAIRTGTSTLLYVDGSAFENNVAGFDGGAIRFDGSGGSSSEVFDSVFDGNSASRAGAVNVNGALSFHTVTISNNSAQGHAGAIGVDDGASVSLYFSTVSGNTAGGYGGGIEVEPDASLTAINSTISGNAATEGGGGISVRGGEAYLEHVTIADNTSLSGGLDLTSGSQVTILLSVVAGNSDSACTGDAATSGGYNVVDDTSCGFAEAGDQQGVDAKLGPLADNGGDTLTHALLAGSPAIDLAPLDGDNGCETSSDQRGVERPQGAGCDSGAFEYSGASVTPTPTPAPTGSATPTDAPNITPPPTSTEVASAGADRSAVGWFLLALVALATVLVTAGAQARSRARSRGRS